MLEEQVRPEGDNKDFLNVSVKLVRKRVARIYTFLKGRLQAVYDFLQGKLDLDYSS